MKPDLEGKKKRLYFVQQSNGEQFRVCSTAWFIAYGVSSGTYKKRSVQFQTLGQRKRKKIRRDGSTQSEQNFIEWLLRQAKKIGDKLPHGDGLKGLQIRLPYPNKEIVHFLFSEFAKKNLIFVDDAKKQIISYEDATSLWKHHPDLQHIKMMRFKGSFSICKICLSYELAIKGHNTVAQREELDRNFFGHITETKKERAQYAKDQVKCSEEKNKFVVAVDAFDKSKTTFPFFVNPPKSAVEGATLVVTKLTAALVHGFGEGVYCYWATDQVCHDTNLTVEVIRRVLLRIEDMNKLKGPLPRSLYLQLDNASDNKSLQFLAFIAYLVEMGVFDSIKVNYLIVGHTHELVDQWFSVLSKFIKRILMQLLTIGAFLNALLTHFKTERCIPKCVEQVKFCYDTSVLSDSVDKQLHRFDLDEKTRDKVHHFHFRRNADQKCVMNYKLKRYSNAVYPRKYTHLGAIHESSVYGTGKVAGFDCFRDPVSKRKYWVYDIVYERETGNIEEKVTVEAKETSIVMFPELRSPLPDTFPLAPYKHGHQEVTVDQKASIRSIFEKLQLTESHKLDMEWWDNFFGCVTDSPNSLPDIQPFNLPKISFTTTTEHHPTLPLPVDDGIRNVDVVTSAQFNAGRRKRAINEVETVALPGKRMDKLNQGMFIIVNLKPLDNNDQELQWYPWEFVVAEIDSDISALDTTNENTAFEVQVYRPCGVLVSLEKKFIKWQGDDHQYFRPTIEQGMVKAIIQIHAQSKKLTKQSKAIIKALNYKV